MFYKVIVRIVKALVYLLNGKPSVQNKEVLPQDTVFLLAAPHRSWLDPVFLAIAIMPATLATMAKQELFRNKVIALLLDRMNAFPVNREEPGPSALKKPVSILKAGTHSVMIFSTGSRYSDEVKGGTSSIARLAGVPIVPAVYQGPFTMKDLLKRKKATVRFGEPIYMEKGKRYTRDELDDIDLQLHHSFKEIDRKIDPGFVHEVKK